MASGKLKYFAYASNLLEERVRYTVGKNSSARIIGTARLQDFDLCFDYYSEEWKGCKATCRVSPGKFIYGILWEVSTDDMVLLDGAEEVHLGKYRQIEVDVTTLQGTMFRCFTYQLGEIMDANGRPSPQYKDIIIRGAKQAGLPGDYITLLSQKEDNGYTGQLRIYDEILQSMSGK